MADDIQRFLAGGFWLFVSMWKTCFEYVRYVLPVENMGLDWIGEKKAAISLLFDFGGLPLVLHGRLSTVSLAALFFVA